MKLLTAFFICMVYPLLLIAQDTVIAPKSDDWKFSVEFRPRPELDGRDFSNSTYPLTFTTMRTRFGVEKSLLPHISFLMQIQDSRIFGEEKNFSNNIKNIDLHQGFAIVKNIFEVPLSIQAGRFEMSYGSERFIGASNWSYIGRTFDGFRGSFTYDFAKVEAFWTISNPSVNTIQSPLPSSPTYTSKIDSSYIVRNDTSYIVNGFWAIFNLMPDNDLHVFTFRERNASATNKDAQLDRFTAGFSYFGAFGSFKPVIELGYQWGSTDTLSSKKDIKAYTASAQLWYNLKPFNFGIGADIISGTDSADLKTKIRTYTPSLGTNHKFFGYMEYFVDKTKGTDNRGINDYYVSLKYGQKADKFNGELNLHYFGTNKTRSDNLNSFGEEVDFILTYNFLKNTYLQWGNGLFFPSQLMKNLYTIKDKNNKIITKREDTGFWSYLSLFISI